MNVAPETSLALFVAVAAVGVFAVVLLTGAGSVLRFVATVAGAGALCVGLGLVVERGMEAARLHDDVTPGYLLGFETDKTPAVPTPGGK